MALPNPLQKLKHGALLCKKNFGTFVETFNFLVDFAQNLRGDGDANGSGSIVVDRSVPDRPVIRSKINMDYPFGEGGGVEPIPRPFEIVDGVVTNCSIPCPIQVVSTSDYTIPDGSTVIYIHIDRSSSSYSATVDNTSRPNSSTHAQFKLYDLDGSGNVTLDSRPMALPLFAF